MVKKKEIIDDFYSGRTKGKASSLKIDDSAKGTALYSYATPIAYRDKSGKVYMTDKKFSVTTTTDQNYLKAKSNVYVMKNDSYKKLLDKNKVSYGFSRL